MAYWLAKIRRIFDGVEELGPARYKPPVRFCRVLKKGASTHYHLDRLPNCLAIFPNASDESRFARPRGRT